MMGYIEVKAPGRQIDPEKMTGHDLEQWNRQKDLPNLIYTNGTEWRLYGDNGHLETILRTFLMWKAAAITSVSALVRAIAPLTRLLCGEVLDQLESEHKQVNSAASEEDQPFMGLAKDWRRLLFPQADDKTFADGYVQSVTFALLLARTTGIDFEGRSLHEVGKELGAQPSSVRRCFLRMCSRTWRPSPRTRVTRRCSSLS
jgi:hypothetical protein